MSLNAFLKKKADEHWKWLSAFLEGFKIEILPEYERLFIDAFLHGGKHAQKFLEGKEK